MWGPWIVGLERGLGAGFVAMRGRKIGWGIPRWVSCGVIFSDVLSIGGHRGLGINTGWVCRESQMVDLSSSISQTFTTVSVVIG